MKVCCWASFMPMSLFKVVNFKSYSYNKLPTSTHRWNTFRTVVVLLAYFNLSKLILTVLYQKWLQSTELVLLGVFNVFLQSQGRATKPGWHWSTSHFFNATLLSAIAALSPFYITTDTTCPVFIAVDITNLAIDKTAEFFHTPISNPTFHNRPCFSAFIHTCNKPFLQIPTLCYNYLHNRSCSLQLSSKTNHILCSYFLHNRWTMSAT